MASFVLRLIYATRSSCVRQMSSSPAPALAPWLMIGDSNVEEDGVDLFYNFYNVADEQVRKEHKRRGKHGVLVGSSHGWIALYKWGQDLYKWRRISRCGFDMFLYNPLSHSYVNLPSVETLAINNDPSFYTTRVIFDEPMAFYNSHLPKKVILSSSPDNDDDDDCCAIMSYGSYKHHHLAYCCLGCSIIWTPFGHPRLSYEDFVYSTGQKQLFCTTKCHKFESWDFGDPLAPRLNWKVGDDDIDDYDALANNSVRSKPDYEVKYLVFAEQSKRLFLVRRNVIKKFGGDTRSLDLYPVQSPPYQTIGFDVHELIVDDDSSGKKRGKLIYMDSKLDGMAFFVGSTGHGFVIEETDEMIKNVKPDSIYYTDPKELTPPPWDREYAYGGHDLGIFNYESRTFSSCCHPSDPRSIKRIEPTPTWFMPSPPY